MSTNSQFMLWTFQESSRGLCVLQELFSIDNNNKNNLVNVFGTEGKHIYIFVVVFHLHDFGSLI